MPQTILPPPPSAGGLSASPRAVLQDASGRANQGTVNHPVIPSSLSQSPPSVEDGNWEAILAKAKKQAKDASANMTTGNSKKRKSGPTLEEDVAKYKQDLSDIYLDDMLADLDCNQVRARINKVLDNKIMKKGEFCTAIKCSTASLNNFLKRSGRSNGEYCDAFVFAWRWFKQREIAGLKMPDVKRRQKSEAAAAATAAAGPAAKKAKKSAAVSEIPDISGIHLRGEETDSIPVYETCDEVRKKITAHLKTPGLTQAQFCRNLFSQLHKPTCKSIQTSQLNDFRGKKGPLAGARSTVFYAAYVYFEKLRIAKDKPKSAHRLEMESSHRGGLDRTFDGRQGLICSADKRPYIDQYGRISVF